MKDSKERFSDRVEDYLRYRPGYPREIIGILERDGVLRSDSVVADIGSGTGFLAELFLEYGCSVYGVEPNPEMRAGGERHLARFPRFRSVPGSAEATTLVDASVDLVTVGQALHWFDLACARREMRRILRPPFWLAIAFNDRDIAASPFMREYDTLLIRHAPDYQRIRSRYPTDVQYQTIFNSDSYAKVPLAYHQAFGEEALVGRVLSSSYAPRAGEEGHEALVAALRGLFARHQSDGRVRFEYRSLLVYGNIRE